MREAPKLPQARRYLRAAQWGCENIRSQKLIGAGAIFHIIGILACLRAVPHALLNHDRGLSPEHQEVISDWQVATKNSSSIPDLHFIVTSRNLLLKDANFEGYAIHSESSIGEDENCIVTDEEYELAYYVDGQRRDLASAIQSAIDWCKGELAKLESKLPPRYQVEVPDEWNFTEGEREG